VKPRSEGPASRPASLSRVLIVALVAASVVAGVALVTWFSPEIGGAVERRVEAAGAHEVPAKREARRAEFVRQQRVSREASRQARAARSTTGEGSGEDIRRADLDEEREMAWVNRELLLETSILNWEAAAQQAAAEGHGQRAALMLRRVDALSATLQAERAGRPM
jgi:hypothetical protein